MDSTEKIIIGLTIAVIVFILGISIIRPYFEAKTFNSCTKSQATYFDALFTELRALDCKK